MIDFHTPQEAKALSENTEDLFFIEGRKAYFQGHPVSFQSFTTFLESEKDINEWFLPTNILSDLAQVSRAVSSGAINLKSIKEDYSSNWYIGWSNKFRKKIRAMDKDIKAKILDAISKIQKDPLSIVGTTQKPLAHPKGSWRYRIGTYRLIYKPIRETGNILLEDFGSRDKIYP
jgi:mRNA-degrading endonuclease RelE of RelBE toxin-antitoxin system